MTGAKKNNNAWLIFQATQRGVAFHPHLKEVTLGLSGQRAGVELSSLILSVLVDHSEDSRTTMGSTTRGAGTGRRSGGAAARRFCFARADSGEENSLISLKQIENKNTSTPVTSTLISGRATDCVGNNGICMAYHYGYSSIWTLLH